jgi:hypothetical protein
LTRGVPGVYLSRFSWPNGHQNRDLRANAILDTLSPVPSVSSPELLVITAVFPKPQKAQQETYVVHARVHNGEWTNHISFRGTSQLKKFLENNRVEAKHIDRLMEQLAIARSIIVSNVEDHSLLLRHLSISRGRWDNLGDVMWT